MISRKKMITNEFNEKLKIIITIYSEIKLSLLR